MTKLSEGAIEALSKGAGGNDAVLQLVNIRKIDGGNGPARFRVMMSDGRHTLSSFMLSTQLNCMAEENLLAPNCICVLKRHVTNILKDGRRVVIILEIDVIKPAEDVAGRIGDPTPYTEGQSKGPQSVQAPVPENRPPLQPQNKNEVNKGFNRDFGKKASSAMPSTPGGSSKVVPIASLNPYQSKWTIRARVTNKSSIRTWSNSRGDGKLFSMEIVDESGEIRVTGFNQEVDKFYTLIEAGKVYYISKGSLKIANKQYTSVKNDYEMTLSGESTIIPCEDSCDVPMVQCDFVSIGDLENKDKDAIVDVIGICKSVDEVTRLTTKTNREVSKRTISLMDMSGKLVTVTLWGEEAEKFDGAGQPIVAIKAAKLSDFGGRSLSASFSSTLMINPDIPEAFKLRGWYDKEGHAMDGQSLTELKGAGGGGNTNWKSLIDVKAEHLGHGDKADYFTCIATVVYLRKENCLYQACPSQDCNKKVVDQQNGMFRCEKCDKEFPNFKYRLILSANIADYGDNQWVTCFQESAEAILGQNAAYLGQLKDSNEAAFDEIFQQANFSTFVFRNRVKLETYNDESRIKATVMEVKPVDHKDYSKRLIMNIRKLAAQ
ncbi:replication protein A 70 kDa DNA-binding subunit [Mugil cephalus]|uniref:replication protein A 70 kDa DNA-binding subunit n=1 Tax=Mugil cephalus TaxID=48193 RepID=UPI001FB81523|nr:replication protein A 70 kDa DNA-binding subunit [Mugil cephalus]